MASDKSRFRHRSLFFILQLGAFKECAGAKHSLHFIQVMVKMVHITHWNVSLIYPFFPVKFHSVKNSMIMKIGREIRKYGNKEIMKTAKSTQEIHGTMRWK